MEPGLAIVGITLLKKKVSTFKTKSEKLADIHVLIIQYPAYASPTVTDKVFPTLNVLQRHEGLWGVEV